MSFFTKLFNRVSYKKESDIPELRKLKEFEVYLDSLLSLDQFLARSDYKFLIESFNDLFETFDKLSKTETLNYYCKEKGINTKRLQHFIDSYKDIANTQGSEIIRRHNEQFINAHLLSESLYLDTILHDIDSQIKLDTEQRKVVLSDEDYTLVIAGAGAGKTTTIAAKVKYLVEKRGIRPDQILVISFTNKAVGELRDKINKGLRIACPVTTFHKTGYAIIRRQDEENISIVDSGFMYNVINNYLKSHILENPDLVNKLILFFGSYFEAPYEGNNLNDFFNYIAKSDFSTLKGNIHDYTEQIINERTAKLTSIVHEVLRSQQEVRIANFLYMNNIDYVYEKPYQYNILQSHKPYTPDFTITQGHKLAYIEHFGISESGDNNLYTSEQLEKYKQAVNDKIKLHREHNTDLIYTFSQYNDGKDFIIHLSQQLTQLGFVLQPRSPREVFEKIVNTEENKYISKFVMLVCTFIQTFKTNGYTLDDFTRFQTGTTNERTKLFLQICEQCYHEYTKRLKERHAIDFEDMINDSARIIREEEIKGDKLDFKYIIVDEYQDISRQRFNLTRELSKLCDAKIVAVGDDWQSIYAYAGSDITLFTHFCKSFGYGQELTITKTYRNAQEVIDIAGSFIQKNSNQIRKALISPKHIKNPIVIQTYTEKVDRSLYEGRGGIYFLIGETVTKILDQIVAKQPKSTILLLGRYGFDAYNLSKSADFVYDEKTGNLYSQKYNAYYIDFMTVHRAKGLGYDNVIIINARDATYGFPSKIKDDPILQYVIKTDRAIEYAEERRLFYVALTRTKNRVYIVTPQQHPSEFVLELIKDHKGQILINGDIETKNKQVIETKKCPICGYPLQLRYKKSYGLKLWICSNEPELCSFMTNNLQGGPMQIMKCDKCKDGYLIVKEGKDGNNNYFLGCTNYKNDKTGCNNYITRTKFMNYIKSYH